MLIPQHDAFLIHQNIPGAQSDGQGGFVVPCTTNASVALTYGGQLFTINPQDLVREAVSDNEGFCVSGIGTDPQISTRLLWLVSVTSLFLAYDNSFILSFYLGWRYVLEERLLFD
jgi:hypothetical protein